MPIAFKRYVKSRELVTFFKIEFRLTAYDFVNILGRYASEHMSDYDEDEMPPSLTKTSAEKYIRDQLHSNGDCAPWTWRDAYLDYQVEFVKRCFEWGRTEAIRLWPGLADDFRKVSS